MVPLSQSSLVLVRFKGKKDAAVSEDQIRSKRTIQELGLTILHPYGMCFAFSLFMVIVTNLRV